MPEILEIEMYRRDANQIVGRSVSGVVAHDPDYLREIDASSLGQVLTGSTVTATRRVGKVMVVETSAASLGLRFGMTGRLVIDNVATIDQLEYSSKELKPEWNRFSLDFEGGGTLTMNDPRRLGNVTVDPDLSSLGVDAWKLTGDVLADLVQGRTLALKSFLLDQKRVAGIGNLLADEILWRCALSPGRQAQSLTASECHELAHTTVRVLDELLARGGSNTGDLFSERNQAGRCPLDGEALTKDRFGGRTTWWCAAHQR